jgi:hypothetical protein
VQTNKKQSCVHYLKLNPPSRVIMRFKNCLSFGRPGSFNFIYDKTGAP